MDLLLQLSSQRAFLTLGRHDLAYGIPTKPTAFNAASRMAELLLTKLLLIILIISPLIETV